MSVISATAPNGVITVNADSVLEYTSNSDFSGTDTITYTVSDGNGGSDTAMVDVVVSLINAMIQTDVNNYLNNLTLHYYKDGMDTGVSTLVENGAISFDQALDFDAIKLSAPEVYLGGTAGMGIKADDAVPLLQDIVNIVGVGLVTPPPFLVEEYNSDFDTMYYNINPNSFNWHAADVNNDGAIQADDAVAILKHVVQLDTIDSFDLIDSVTFERIGSFNFEATETANWTIVANGDVNQDGVWDANYTTDIV